MDNQLLINKLIYFGLTRQEATIYLTLLVQQKMTGYEMAKQTGISRSNVYNALAGLVDKGAAYMMESTVTKYLAVPIEEFCNNKISSLEKIKEDLVKYVPKAKEDTTGYMTISGSENIWNKVRYMILQTDYRIYLVATKEKISSLEKEIKQLSKKHVKVVIITDEEIVIPDAKIYLQELDKKQIRVISDSKYVLTGAIENQTEGTCLYSGQEDFVRVFKDYLRNEIKLIELNRSGKENE